MKLIAIYAVVLSVGLCEQPSIRVANGDRAAIFTEATLRDLPQQTVKANDHGTVTTFQGVLLSDILTKVGGVPFGDALKGAALSRYVVVEAWDEYRVVFAVAELDPAFSEKRVFLVTKRDGKPLSEKEGPFRIVVPDERKASRWVRQVRSVTVKQGN